MRLFFAVKLPQEFFAEVKEFCDSFPQTWRQVKLEQLHITLAFMGNFPEDEIDTAIAAGEKAAKEASEFELSINETGCFPDEQSPRVLFARAESAPMRKLAGLLIADLSKFCDRREFKPHLTLARKRKGSPKLLKHKFAINFPVKEFYLIHSKLLDQGSIHEVIKAFPLKG
jgi:2'-5' RNA ligase